MVNNISLFKTASNAYSNTAKMQISPSVEQSKNSVFSTFFKNYLNDSIDKVHKSEKLSMDALQGKADITSVVTAVSQAEVTLQTVITIRDKIISAYQDIIKMQI